MLPSLSFHTSQPLLLLPIQKSAAVLGLVNVLSEVITSLPSSFVLYSLTKLLRLSDDLREGTVVVAITLPFKTVNPLELYPAKPLCKPSLFNASLYNHLFYAIFGVIYIVCFYFLQKKSIAKSTIIAFVVTSRLASLSLIDDFTTEDKKLVAKCNILLTGLSSSLLLSMASMP